MEGLTQYLISVVAAALICGFVSSFFSKESPFAVVCKLLTGLFLSLTVISPMVDIEWSDLRDHFEGISADADAVTAWGEEFTQRETAQIIKTQTEAYILDKAASVKAEISVTVTLSAAQPQKPVSAEISGNVSPYAKAQLSGYMENELGIPKEAQVWTG